MSTLFHVFQTHHESVDATLQEIALAVRNCVPGAEQASISIARRGHTVRTLAATGPVAAEVDGLQTELGDGPCLHALFECRAVRIPIRAPNGGGRDSRQPRTLRGSAACCPYSYLSNMYTWAP